MTRRMMGERIASGGISLYTRGWCTRGKYAGERERVVKRRAGKGRGWEREVAGEGKDYE